MKKAFLFFLFVSSLAAPAGAETLFDDRDWRVAYRTNDGVQSIIVYTLAGETIAGSSELVTVASTYGLEDVTSAEYLRRSREYLFGLCPGARWNEISRTENDAIYEWSVSGCAGADERVEIARFFTGGGAMHVLRYAATPPVEERKRLEWIEILRNAKLGGDA